MRRISLFVKTHWMLPMKSGTPGTWKDGDTFLQNVVIHGNVSKLKCLYTCSEGMLALTNDVTQTDRHSQTSELSLLFALLLWLLSNGRRRPFGFLHLLCGFAITGLRLLLQCTHRKQWSPCHFTSPLSQWVNTISAGYSCFFFFFFHKRGWILLHTGSYW